MPCGPIQAWLRIGAGLLYVLAPFATARAQTTTATAPASQPDRAEQVGFLVRLLTGDNAPETRREAAEKLLAMRAKEATQALKQVFAAGNSLAAKTAVCQALAADEQPDGAFVTVLLPLLGHKEPAIQAAAGRALAAFQHEQVIKQLVAVAADAKRPLIQRLGAVRTLTQARNIAQAIDGLISLMGMGDAAVRAEVLEGLRQFGPSDLGDDGKAWRAWWKQHRGNLPWVLASKLRQRERDYRALVADYVRELRVVLNASPKQEAKTALILDWLKHEIAAKRRTALELVHEALRDGKEPASLVVEQIRLSIADADETVRSGAILVLRDLRKPADAALVLDRLPAEQSRLVKEAMFSALGRLGDRKAIPACVAGLADPSERVASEAAAALGLLCAKRNGGDAPPPGEVEPAVNALIARFRQAEKGTPQLRERLVAAMARIADPSFATLLRSASDGAEPSATMRQAALGGLAAIGDAANVDVVISRLADKDPGVRESACDALAVLGRGPEHLTALRERLDAAAEPTKSVQTRAWTAYLALFKKLPEAAAQLQQLEQFDPKAGSVDADRVAELLIAVEQRIAAHDPTPKEIVSVRERLGDALMMLNRAEDAAGWYKRAVGAAAKLDPPAQDALAVKLTSSLLTAGKTEEALKVAEPIAGRKDGPRDALVKAFVARAQQLTDDGDPDGALALLDAVAKKLAGTLGDVWAKQGELVRSAAREAQTKQDQANVATWVAQLKSGGEAEKSALASILALRGRAIRPLGEQLRVVVSADPVDQVQEKRIVELLKRLRPDWSAYDKAKTPEQKLGAIEELLKAG